MSDCKIVNQSVITAVNAIGGSTEGSLEGLALKYQEAGTAFVEALTTAISTMEGATKDALEKFFTDKVKPFVAESVPNAVKSTAMLLEANRANFESVDKQIADSITSGGK